MRHLSTPNEKIEIPYHIFGSENQGNENISAYANDDSYLYLEVEDNDLRAVKLTINEKKSVEITQSDLSEDEWKIENNGRGSNNKYSIYIKISKFKEQLSINEKNTITVVALDNDPNHKSNVGVLKIDDNNQYSVFYDPNDNKDSLISIKPSTEPATQNNQNYYGKGYKSNAIVFDISDDNGLKNYSVKVNGTDIASFDLSKGIKTNGAYTPIVTETYMMPTTKHRYNLPLNESKYDFTKDGRYEIGVSAEDLAGNKHNENYSFIIDTTAPIIEQCEYKYNRSLLKYLSFGLFGNESYEIAVRANDPDSVDNVPGIGIESVVLKWDSDTYEGKYNTETDMYEFDSLPVGHSDIPTIVITDKLGNSANYCMASADNNDQNKDNKANIQLQELTLDESKGKIPLVLENISPTSSIIPSESFAVPENNKDELKVYKQEFEDGHTEWWYPNSFEYQITAQDDNSGLFSVIITENGEQRALENKYGDTSFNSSSFVDKAIYNYSLSEEGDYKLFTYALDNAQNSNRKNPKPDQSLIVHLDKTKPQVTEFQFGGKSDQGDTVERTTYGFFFMEDTEVRVYIDDTGVSSGLNNVVLYLKSVNGKDKTFTKTASSFNTDQQNGRKYASFTIEKGFKGKVTSIVTDNVGHSSGLINANGNIVEDPDLHLSTSSIEIKENEAAKQNDANGVPLYNTSVPVTVTIVDTFSGISTIEWSIANDNEKGKIEVDVDGNWRNAEGEARIIEDSIERDQNLITKLQFAIIVDSNSNGNVVHVTLTDRSGNSSDYETTYSIDTTAPSISASLSGGKSSNGYYYNTNQTVTVSVTERNFDPSAVVVKINNNAQMIQWNDQGSSVTTDDTVHTGTFTITADGEYNISISYTDMAGNVGTPYSKSRFIIDKTSPKISNNFESFGSLDDENIYYNISQKDKAKAEITVVETNFIPDDMHISVFYQPAGSKHSDTGANWSNYYYKSDWKDNGDGKHTLSIPFTEDGVYKISMSPVDRAGNAGDFSKGENSQYPIKTAIFETDYTAPIIVSRDGKSVRSDDTKFYDLYDFERRNDAAPTIIFEDTNIDRIECKGQKYTPVYTNGKEIGEIKPEDISSKSSKMISDTYVPQMIYTLNEFTTDGVYSAKLTAYDKAGNKSILNDNTYVHMVDPTVKVLAYIENSSRENLEGWYSFEDENGPISKQPSSFSDLSIVVLSKTSSDTHIYLVDKATGDATDTHITDNKEDALFDKEMFEIGAYRYTLTGEYFEKNYTADTDTNLYLRVVNNEGILDLGEMYIDNTDPDCDIPKYFHDWGWFKGSGNLTLNFDNVSEILDINETVAYVDGQTIHLSNVAGNETSTFSYDEKNSTLSLTLEPGSHKVGLLLVDRAGNTKSITEVQHLAIGNYRIWIGVGAGLGAILLAAITVFVVKKVKRRKLV